MAYADSIDDEEKVTGEYEARGPDPLTAMTALATVLYEELKAVKEESADDTA